MNATTKSHIMTITAATFITFCVLMFAKLPDQNPSTSEADIKLNTHIDKRSILAIEDLLGDKQHVILFISSCDHDKACILAIDKYHSEVSYLPESQLVYHHPARHIEESRRLFTFSGSI